MNLKLSDIRIDGGTQARVQPDWIAIGEYAQAMKDGAQFPPVIVFYDGTDYWLADGFHRVEAAGYAELTEIDADVHKGTLRDAQWFAMGANKTYGVRMNQGDREHILEKIFSDETWSSIPINQIAVHTGIPEPTVRRRYQHSLSSSVTKIEKPDERTIIRNGTTYTMNTANIGKPKPIRNASFDDGWGNQPDEDEQYRDELTGDTRNYDWTIQSLPVNIEDEHGHVETIHINGPESSSKLSVHFSSESPEHYTPESILDLVIEVMSKIDLDPCSNSKDDPHVPAADHYTAEDDGLTLPWHGSVYMNPPYGRVIGEWVTKLVGEFEAGNVTEAIALVPARTDTEWWNRLTSCNRTIPLVCFIRGRLTFIGNEDPAPFPSAVVYLGDNRTEFYEVFSAIGRIWATWNDELAGLVNYGSA